MKRKKKLTLTDLVNDDWKKRFEDKPKNRWQKGWQTRRKNHLAQVGEILNGVNQILKDSVWVECK